MVCWCVGRHYGDDSSLSILQNPFVVATVTGHDKLIVGTVLIRGIDTKQNKRGL